MSRRSCTARYVVAALMVSAATFLFQVGVFASVVDQAQVQYDKGAALEKQEKHTEAIAEWQSLLTQHAQAFSDPQLTIVKAEALYAIGEAQRQSDQLSAAQSTFAAVLSSYPQCRPYCADAVISLAKVYQKNEDYPNALRQYAKVLTDYPDRTTRADFARTRIYEVQKKAGDLPSNLRSLLEDAIATYEKAKRADDLIIANRKKAIADAEAGKIETAKAALLAQFDDPKVNQSCARLRMLGMAQLQIGDRKAVRPTFEKLLTLAASEYSPEGYAELSAELHLYMGDYVKALTDTEAALQSYTDAPSTMPLMFYRARSLDMLDQVDDCLSAYQSLTFRFSNVQDPERREMMATALARLGNRLSCLGKTDEAKTYLQRAVDEYPGTGYAGSAANSLRDLSAKGVSQQ
jgi:tetratricopeptide (TPR) repeat protein